MKFQSKLLAIALCGALIGTAFGTTPQKKSSRKARAKQPPPQVQLPPVPEGPLQPLPLDTVPVVAPEVSYENGTLSILAKNSSLGDILKLVQKYTGASIDVPSPPNDRVVTNLGPGPARDVLAKLLNGSKYNYVMLGSPSDPLAVSKIILTAKSGGPADAPGAKSAATFQYQRPVYQGRQPAPAQVMPQPSPDAEEAVAEEEQPEPEPEETVDPAEQAEGEAAATPAQPGQDPATGTNGPRTPEQLLQELQRQQQLLLQQQQQQGQNQPGQPAAPNQGNQPPQE